MKNSIYTLPLLLLCFISLTSFSISWPQFNEWIPNRTWFRLPTQQDLPVWMQAFVNKIKQFLVKKEINKAEKSDIIYNMLDKQFIPEQIKFLEAQEKNYRQANNDGMITFVSDLKEKMKKFITAKDWIDFLEEQKEAFKTDIKLEEKINSFIDKINQNIEPQKNAFIAKLNGFKTKEEFINFLKNQYALYTKEQISPFPIQYYYQDPFIKISALNMAVIDLLKQNKINENDIIFKISLELTNNDHEKASQAILQALAIFNNQQTSEEILQSIKTDLITASDKITYLEQKKSYYAKDRNLSMQINALLRQEAYKILGLPEGARETEIRDAYKKLAFKWHPNKNIGNEAKAAEEFKKIKAAYEVFFPKEFTPTI